jgi:hypothetical protein
MNQYNRSETDRQRKQVLCLPWTISETAQPFDDITAALSDATRSLSRQQPIHRGGGSLASASSTGRCWIVSPHE